MIRIALSTLGCKINQAESAAILAQFDAAEYSVVAWEEAADIYIINTCTVTNRTDYKSRFLIRTALARKAQNPLVKVVVTGCFAQRSAAEIASLGEVDFIVDNQQKLDIATILAGSKYVFRDIMDARDFSYKPFATMHERTRAFQKIQDGCDFYCAYCAVPYARGHARSAPLEQVLQQARLFVAHGYKEIVLGGVNLGLYHDGKHDLGDVAEKMAQIEGLELIRLSSIEPQLLSQKLIQRLQAIPQICPHFHIPLQSGCDAVLGRMKRRYNTALMKSLVYSILGAFPDAAIGCDVITGFPGESEAEHSETQSFIQSLPLAYLHVFSYSKRKGTPADTMPNQVPKAIKNQRARQLSDLSEQLKQNYAAKLKEGNVTLRGIAETHKHGGTEFLSDHYLRVLIPQLIPIGELAEVSSLQAQIILS